MTAKSPLRQLADIISECVDEIDKTFGQRKQQYPRLDEPFDLTSPEENTATSPEVDQAAQLVVAACGQLSTLLKRPTQTLYEVATGFHLSSCLRVALRGNIAEILREGGNVALHTTDIAAKSGLDPDKQARVLRLLATHHIFREMAPNVFTNNRLSSMMDTQKSVNEICTNPEDKHTGTPGSAALYEHITDEMFKGSAVMGEVLSDPVKGHSDAAEHAPVMVAFECSGGIWEWLDEPGNEHRRKRFNAAMVGSSRMDPPTAILEGLDWSTLTPGSIVVDVGGGVGSTTLKIAEKFPELRYVVQDRPSTIEDAKQYWNENLPKMLQDGSVELQVHDFFTPQPQKNAAVFLLRKIIHDYGRVKAIKILQQLRDAATPHTKLLMLEILVPYACPQDGSDRGIGHVIHETPARKPPSPLLSNLGKANALRYLADLQMYVGLNAEERTLGSFVDITRDSGWRITQIFTIPGSQNKHIVAVPA